MKKSTLWLETLRLARHLNLLNLVRPYFVRKMELTNTIGLIRLMLMMKRLFLMWTVPLKVLVFQVLPLKKTLTMKLSETTLIGLLVANTFQKEVQATRASISFKAVCLMYWTKIKLDKQVVTQKLLGQSSRRTHVICTTVQVTCFLGNDHLDLYYFK